MTVKIVAIAVLLLSIMGCSSKPTIQTISQQREVDVYLKNNEETIGWVYCGKTENSEIVLKRVDGEFELNGSVALCTLKWKEEKWFLVSSDAINLPEGLELGSSLQLCTNEFKKMDAIWIKGIH
jgi:hypothetical protein